MKFKLSMMRFSTISDHHEIYNEVIDADKIILDTKAKRYEIDINKPKDSNFFGYPNQFIGCLLLTEKNGVKKNHGYFTKIVLTIDPNENVLGILSIEEVLFQEDVDRYFKVEYPKAKKSEKIDVQTISVEDFMIQSKITLMKEARSLFKRRKNVK